MVLSQQHQVRALGVSNFGVKHLSALLADGPSLPIAVNQIELHPWWPQLALRKYCKEKHIALMAYGSLGSSLLGGATLRSPAVAKVSKRVGRSPAQVLLRWAVQQGVAVIPSTSSDKRMAQNLDLFGWELTDTDMRDLEVGPADRMRIFLPDPDEAP